MFVEPDMKVPLAQAFFDESEPAAIAEVVKSGWLCQGPKVQAFEDAFAEKIGAKYAVAVNSGSTALTVALQALGLKAGDEVIVPNMTFIATATSAMVFGGVPVFCDVDARTYHMNPNDIERWITPKTKAIIPVHSTGHMMDMDPIMDIARKHNLIVLEDAAPGHLIQDKQGRYAGRIGHASIFSFTPTKLMTTGEGGMIVTDDEAVSRRCRTIRNFGDHGKFNWASWGFNYRMTDMAASLGLCQLQKLPEMIEARRQKARYYRDALAVEESILLPVVPYEKAMNYQLFTIRLQTEQLTISRDAVIEALAKRGISSKFYHPVLHRQGVFAGLGSSYRDEQFPGAIAYEKSAFSLPIFTGMTKAQQDYVISNLLDILKSAKR